MIADQLVDDYRSGTWSVEGLSPTGPIYQGDSDAVGTMTSHIATAKDHGEDFTEDDWIALVQELARRVAFGPDDPGCAD